MVIENCSLTCVLTGLFLWLGWQAESFFWSQPASSLCLATQMYRITSLTSSLLQICFLLSWLKAEYLCGLSFSFGPKMTVIAAISCAFLFSILCETSALVLPNSTDLLLSDNNFTDIETALAAHLDSAKIPKARRKRYISQNDMIAILDYHNQVRGKVFPPASNMEYMVSELCLFPSKTNCKSVISFS